MTSPFSYSTIYVLDRSHFSETFDESVTLNNAKNIYLKPIVLALLGLAILIFTDVSPYGAWFIVALGALEFLSIRFRKPWWLARQMMSKAANNELTLTIDEHGINSKSLHVESNISWAEIKKIEQTAQGWLFYHAGGKNYISSRCLSADAKEFMTIQASLKS